MPFSSIASIPDRIKKFSPKLQRQWMNVFNSVWNKLKDRPKEERERRAFMAANSVLKKRFKKGQNLTKESHSDYFRYLMNDYLGNLKG